MPETLAVAIAAAFPSTAATAFTIGTTAVSYATIIANVAVIGGSIAYSSSQSSKLRRALNTSSLDQGRSVMVRDPIVPWRYVYGTVVTSGNIVFACISGTKNEYLHIVMKVADHECEAFDEYRFGSEVVPVDGSGDATGKYAGHARIKAFLGIAAGERDTDLETESGGLWTANHLGKGKARIHVRLKWNPDLFSSGIPTLKVLVRGKKVYDWRTTTTAFNDNSALCAADWAMDTKIGKGIPFAKFISADQIEQANTCDEDVGIATTFTRSCAVDSGNRHIGMTTQALAQLAGMYVGMQVNGTGVPAGSRIVSLNLVSPYFFTIDQDPTATNDPITLTFGDVERRYTCNGTANGDQDPDAVLTDMVGSMAGHWIDTGGKFILRAGAYRASTVTLTEDDIIGGFTMQPRQSRQDGCNRVRGLYISPQNQWAPGDFPAVARRIAATALTDGERYTIVEVGDTDWTLVGAASSAVGVTFTASDVGSGAGTGIADPYMGQDGGVRLDRDIQLNYTTASAMAQRIAAIELERARQQITVESTYSLKALQLMPGDTMALTRARYGFSAKEFEVADWTLKPIGDESNPGLGVGMTARETAEAIYDDYTDTAVDLAPNSTLWDPSSVMNPTGLSLTVASFRQPEGVLVPQILAEWTAAADEFVQKGGSYLFEYKKSSESDWTQGPPILGDKEFAYVPGVEDGEDYDFRMKSINVLGVMAAAWVQVLNFTVTADTTPPAAPTGLAAVTGTGKAVVITWSANSEGDFSGEYSLWRHTSNVPDSATRIVARVAATRAIDIDVTIGTTYYYWVTALDYTGNESSKSSGVNATPGVITSAAIDQTAPSDTTDATKTGEGVDTANDGTITFYLTFSLPAIPANATSQVLQYRRNGATQWTKVGEFTNTGTATGVQIPGLPLGSSFEVSTIGYNGLNGKFSSAATNATSSPFTVSTGPTPAAVTGLTLSTASGYLNRIPPAYSGAGGAKYSAAMLIWTRSTAKDVAYYEVYVQTTLATLLGTTQGTEFPLYAALQVLTSTDDLHVRAVTTSGAVSSYTTIGPPHGFSPNYGTEDMAEQARDDVEMDGVRTGDTGASSVRKVLARYQIETTPTLTGGALFEDVSVSLSNRGFSTRPDVVLGPSTITADNSVTWVYRPGSSSSTAGVVRLYTLNGFNLPAGANYTLHLEFVEYD